MNMKRAGGTSISYRGYIAKDRKIIRKEELEEYLKRIT